jgi:hypothetical protein
MRELADKSKELCDGSYATFDSTPSDGMPLYQIDEFGFVIPFPPGETA